MKTKDCPVCGRMHCICVSHEQGPLAAIVEAKQHIENQLLSLRVLARKLEDVGMDSLGSQIRSLANQIEDGVDAINDAVNRKLDEDLRAASTSVGLTLKTILDINREDE